MKSNSIFLCLLISTVMLLSCQSKKLQTQVDQLQAENTNLTNDVKTLKQENADLTTRNKTLTDEYTQYKTTCDATTQKLKTTEEELSVFKSAEAEEAEAMARLETRLDSALTDFQERGVDVYVKDQLLHVSLQDQLLYKPGSASLGEDGKKALGALASVLNDYPNLKMIIVGNTDSIQFKKGGTDNWSLSTERANGVVRVLRDKYKMDPTRMTSAGKGRYDPVADNGTAEGRAKNRRTDIVLNPDLAKLYREAKQQ